MAIPLACFDYTTACWRDKITRKMSKRGAHLRGRTFHSHDEAQLIGYRVFREGQDNEREVSTDPEAHEDPGSGLLDRGIAAQRKAK